MLRYAVVLLLVLVSASTVMGFEMGLGVGFETYDQESYMTLLLSPDFQLGRLGVGMDLVLRFNTQGIRVEDWNQWPQSLVNSLRYVSWGYKEDPFHARFGVLEGSRLGAGILIRNYSNITWAESVARTRRLGMVFDLDLDAGGIETVVNDILSPGLFGARLYLRPFYQVPNLSRHLQVGGSYAKDLRYDFAGVAVDLRLPLHAFFIPYAQVAQAGIPGVGWGQGASAGIMSQERGGFQYRAEVRALDENFIPGLVNQSYEEKAPQGFRARGYATHGYLVEARLGLGRFLWLTASYESLMDQWGEYSDPTLHGEFEVDGYLLRPLVGRQVGLKAGYHQSPYTRFGDWANERTQVWAQVQVEVVPAVYANYGYKVRFTPEGEPITSMEFKLNTRIAF